MSTIAELEARISELEAEKRAYPLRETVELGNLPGLYRKLDELKNPAPPPKVEEPDLAMELHDFLTETLRDHCRISGPGALKAAKARRLIERIFGVKMICKETKS